MGSGTDVAVESAPVMLLRGDVRGIVRARDLPREARHSIKQNPIFACFYNAAGVSTREVSTPSSGGSCPR